MDTAGFGTHTKKELWKRFQDNKLSSDWLKQCPVPECSNMDMEVHCAGGDTSSQTNLIDQICPCQKWNEVDDEELLDATHGARRKISSWNDVCHTIRMACEIAYMHNRPAARAFVDEMQRIQRCLPQQVSFVMGRMDLCFLRKLIVGERGNLNMHKTIEFKVPGYTIPRTLDWRHTIWETPTDRRATAKAASVVTDWLASLADDPEAISLVITLLTGSPNPPMGGKVISLHPLWKHGREPVNQGQLDLEAEEVTQKAEKLDHAYKYNQLQIGACDGIIFMPLFKTEKALREALVSMYSECKARVMNGMPLQFDRH